MRDRAACAIRLDNQPTTFLVISESGVEIISVPVYFPDVTQILGKQVGRSLVAVLLGQNAVKLERPYLHRAVLI